MHKKKDEIRDIYQSGTRDFEKDFTPQVAQEQLESRQRDLRRSQLASLFFGVLVIVLAVILIAAVVREFLGEQKPNRNTAPAEEPRSPRLTLPIDTLWIMDHPQTAAEAETSPGPKPVSARWVKNAAYHTIMGQQALAVNEQERALEHFRKVIEDYPDIQGLNLAMGTLFLQRKEYAFAAQRLEKAVLEEETFDTVNNLGSAYIGTEEYDKAEKYLKRAHDLQPQNPVCYKNLAGLYRKMKRDSDAIYNYEKYIDLQPGDLDTMQTYALYLTKLGRWKEAADFLTNLTKEVTNVAPVYFLLAQVQVQNGHQDKAIEALKRGIQLVDPNLALTWMSRAEFNAIRGTAEFKSLTDQLKNPAAAADKKQ